MRKSIESGRCVALIRYYKSPFFGEVFDIMWKELKDTVNICDILDKYFDYVNKHKKIFKKIISHNLKNIEILIKVKKQNVSTTSLVNYYFKKN